MKKFSLVALFLLLPLLSALVVSCDLCGGDCGNSPTGPVVQPVYTVTIETPTGVVEGGDACVVLAVFDQNGNPGPNGHSVQFKFDSGEWQADPCLRAASAGTHTVSARWEEDPGNWITSAQYSFYVQPQGSGGDCWGTSSLGQWWGYDEDNNLVDSGRDAAAMSFGSEIRNVVIACKPYTGRPVYADLHVDVQASVDRARQLLFANTLEPGTRDTTECVQNENPDASNGYRVGVNNLF